MNTTPEQLRLAADIFENGWEFEISEPKTPDNWMTPTASLGFIIANMTNGVGFHIRIKPLAFPPLPENCVWHNPDNLPAEQVGDGWRLLVVDCSEEA